MSGRYNNLAPLIALHAMSVDDREAFADRCTPEQLADLLASAVTASDFVASIAYPLVDRTARARWLDRGSNAFAEAYRAIPTAHTAESPPDLAYTLDGYRAQIEAERAELRAEFARAEARMNRLIAALSESCGDVVALTIAQHARDEQAALANGILDPTRKV
jgi:hypothetical protein